MSDCEFDTGDHCEYLSEDLRPDSGLSLPCVVPSCPESCIFYRPAYVPEQIEDDFLIRLLDDDGEEEE